MEYIILYFVIGFLVGLGLGYLEKKQGSLKPELDASLHFFLWPISVVLFVVEHLFKKIFTSS